MRIRLSTLKVFELESENEAEEILLRYFGGAKWWTDIAHKDGASDPTVVLFTRSD